MGVEIPIILLITFFATLSVYNFALWRPRENENWRIFLAFGALIMCLFLGVKYLQLNSLLLLSTMAIFSFMYSLPMDKIGLRWIPIVKIFLIAFIWVNVIVLFPYIVGRDLGLNLNWDSSLYASIFLFVFGVTIPFDIRDMKKDSLELKTIPQWVGLKASKVLSVVFLGLSLFLFGIDSEITNDYKVAFIITCLLGILLTLFSSIRRNKWYFSFWIEGLSALPWVLYLLLK